MTRQFCFFDRASQISRKGYKKEIREGKKKSLRAPPTTPRTIPTRRSCCFASNTIANGGVLPQKVAAQVARTRRQASTCWHL